MRFSLYGTAYTKGNGILGSAVFTIAMVLIGVC